jgi:predicted Zn-dependent peptidase
VSSGQRTGQGPAPAAMDPYEELKKLKELLDMGIVTQEEFDAKKKKLLDL